MRDDEPVSPCSSKGRKRIARLRRRLAYLEDLDEAGGANSRDRGDISSLRWAIRLLEERGAEDRRAIIERHGSTDIDKLLESIR